MIIFVGCCVYISLILNPIFYFLFYFFSFFNLEPGVTRLERMTELAYFIFFLPPLRLTMMTRGEMRIRPEETGPINWILFCPWWAMRWDWGTCGGSLISPSKMVEVRVLGRCLSFTTQRKQQRKMSFFCLIWSENLNDLSLFLLLEMLFNVSSGYSCRPIITALKTQKNSVKKRDLFSVIYLLSS